MKIKTLIIIIHALCRVSLYIVNVKKRIYNIYKYLNE